MATATGRNDAIKWDMVVAYVHPATIDTVSYLLGGVETLDMVDWVRDHHFREDIAPAVAKLTRDVTEQLVYGRQFWLMISCPEAVFKSRFARYGQLCGLEGVQMRFGTGRN